MTQEGPGGEERENFDTKQETNSNKAAGGNDAAAADGAHQLEADGGMRERESFISSKSCSDYWTHSSWQLQPPLHLSIPPSAAAGACLCPD